jgi:hypothetical protein
MRLPLALQHPSFDSPAAAAMLLFVVPVKSPRLSRDWALTSRLFERCVRSICAQTAAFFRVVVVCNERPRTSFEHPHLEYLEVDFPVPETQQPGEAPATGYDYGLSGEIARKNADKARKLRAGLDHGARHRPTHSMGVDADDCVSNRLAAFVAGHPQAPGWFFSKGFIHPEGRRLLFLNVKNFNQTCGSSAIVRYDLRHLLFEKPDFYAHCFDRAPLEPLPFPGAIYSIANGDNIYMTADTTAVIQGSFWRRLLSPELPQLVQKALKYRPAFVTGRVREEFGLYPVALP